MARAAQRSEARAGAERARELCEAAAADGVKLLAAVRAWQAEH